MVTILNVNISKHWSQERMNMGVNGRMLGGPRLDGDFRERRGDEVLLYCTL